MKKLLLVLLIAVTSSAIVQIESVELNNFFPGWIKKIGEFIRMLTGKLKDFYNWLMDNGYWEEIIEFFKKYGVPKAIELCSNLTEMDDLCSDIINLLASFIN